MTSYSTEGPTTESISFVIVTENGAALTETNLRAIQPCLHASDEVIVLTRADRAHDVPIHESWMEVVGIADDASLFALRKHIPAICRKDWIVVVEEHALLDGGTIDRIRELIHEQHEIDMIAFLSVNRTSTEPWSWAAFLHSLAPVWAPLDAPPPFAQVTSVIVRHARIGSEVLAEGEWEFRTIPEIYASGKFSFSNEIYVNHHKPLTMAGCLAINFCNGWACTHIIRTLGTKPRLIRKDGRRLVRQRPRELMNLIDGREAELPTGMRWRLYVVGLAHYVGIMIGSVFAAGRSLHKFD